MVITANRAPRSAVWVAAALLAVACPTEAAAQGDLKRARTLYNAGQFEEAIEAATLLRGRPDLAPSATLIIARSRLERFRRLGDPQQLETARQELRSLNPRSLAPQEAIEWQIGLGTALFLEEQAGPAAEIFKAVIPSARARLTPTEFEKLLEWWGSTLSRLAESLSGDARTQAYERFRSDVSLELERNPLSAPATYWMVVSSRGAGDLDGAWNAAVAGWIRAGTHPEGRQLRSELEVFVMQTLIPERAQSRTGQRLDAKATMTEIAALNQEWRTATTRWSGED
jgi:tetratricopeptide (TPR) repeat protein